MLVVQNIPFGPASPAVPLMQIKSACRLHVPDFTVFECAGRWLVHTPLLKDDKKKERIVK